MSDIFYSLHAQRVIKERGVTPAEIEEVVRRPETTYRGRSATGTQMVHQRGDLAVVVASVPDGRLVVTVLRRSTERWTSEEMRSKR